MTRNAGRPESLTLADLRTLLAELAAAGGEDRGPLSAADVDRVLRRHGLADLPLDVVSALVDAVSRPSGGPVSSLPLRRLEELMDRIG